MARKLLVASRFWRELSSSSEMCNMRLFSRGVTDAASPASSEPGWGQTLIGDVIHLKAEQDQGKWLFCSRDDTVFSAVMKMAKANVGSLLVFDASKISGRHPLKASKEAVCGIITERDYLTKVACEGRASKETKVEEIMTAGSKLVTVTPKHTVVETMELMADNNVRHVPVVEEESMMGMVSIRDMVKVMVREHRNEMANVERYIQGMY